MKRQLNMILPFLRCPDCREGEFTVEHAGTSLRCEHCGKRYQIRNGILDLLAEQDAPLANKAFGRLSAKSYDVFAARSVFRKLYRWKFEDEFDEYTRPVELLSSDIICDVGCGTGNYTLQFARKLGNGIAIGVDISWAMLELLVQHAYANRIENVVAVRANAENLPFKDESLCKIFNGCLHHLFPNIQPSLGETFRCLGQGNVFFGSTFFAAKSHLLSVVQQIAASAMSARPVVVEVLERRLNDIGFRNVKVSPGQVAQFFFGSFVAVK
jgi:ubiquinone/menaquinone biosynthesis C-methylase UbiE